MTRFVSAICALLVAVPASAGQGDRSPFSQALSVAATMSRTDLAGAGARLQDRSGKQSSDEGDFDTFGWLKGKGVGIKGGVGFASIDGPLDSRAERKVRPGFIGGISLAFHPQPWASLRAEFGISMKGQKYRIYENTDAEVQLGYLEMPLLIGIGPHQAEGTTVQAFAGPSLGYCFLSKSWHRHPYRSEDIGNAVRQVEFSVVIGVAFGLGSSSWVEIRMIHGITDIAREADRHGGGAIRTRTVALMLGIGSL